MFLLGIYKKSLGHLAVSSLGKGRQEEAQFLEQSGTVAEKDEGCLHKAGLSEQLCKAVKETPRESSLTSETDLFWRETALQVEGKSSSRSFPDEENRPVSGNLSQIYTM